MCKSLAVLALLAGLSLHAPSDAAPVGPDAARCATGGDALLVSVSGFKSRIGLLRVQLYGGNPADFLNKGQKLSRIEVPITAGTMDVCVPVPGPGRYAVAVRHDANGNKGSDWNDGGGFSRNPRVTVLSYKPKHRDVVIAVGPGVHRVPVVMQYRQGLSIGPLKKSKA